MFLFEQVIKISVCFHGVMLVLWLKELSSNQQLLDNSEITCICSLSSGIQPQQGVKFFLDFFSVVHIFDWQFAHVHMVNLISCINMVVDIFVHICTLSSLEISITNGVCMLPIFMCAILCFFFFLQNIKFNLGFLFIIFGGNLIEISYYRFVMLLLWPEFSMQLL